MSVDLQKPFVVVVGGLDPGGGAGLVRDFATAAALDAQVYLVASAWTAQSARGVASFEPRAAEAIGASLAHALAHAPGSRISVKVGMVATPQIVKTIVAALEWFAGPVVFDPVLAASSGGALFTGDARELMPLVGRATLVTPNLAEAAALAGSRVESMDDARAAAAALRVAGARAVLIKGGHRVSAGHLGGADTATDLLVGVHGELVFSAPRVPGASPRGTGCALATAIAVELARGRALAEAIDSAKTWLTERIGAARVVGDERHL